MRCSSSASLAGVAAEQVQHVLRGADRALDAAQRVAAEQVLDPLEGDQQLVGGGREPLAEGGGLRGHVVRAAGHHQLAVLPGELPEPGQHRDRTVPGVLQRQPDLQLLDVLGQVAGRHALVDLLVPGERVELLDPRLHVVPGDLLALGDRAEVDLLQHPLVVRDGLLGHLDAEVLLRPQHGEPQAALQHHLLLGGPEGGELRRGVAAGEDVRDTRLVSHVCGAYRLIRPSPTPGPDTGALIRGSPAPAPGPVRADLSRTAGPRPEPAGGRGVCVCRPRPRGFGRGPEASFGEGGPASAGWGVRGARGVW